MTVNLRLSLTVFTLGFAAESVSGFITLATGATELPFHGLVLALTPAFSALGILLLWLGRHEWNELHRRRVGHVNAAFAATIVATVCAGVPVAYFGLAGGTGSGWVGLEFGAAVAVIFAVTFVTYALVAGHLVGRVGKVAMGVGLAWAVVVSGLIGLALTPEFGTIVRLVGARSLAVGGLFRPILLLDALLAFSYLAFFVAFLDAHHRVAVGRPTGPVPVGTA